MKSQSRLQVQVPAVLKTRIHEASLQRDLSASAWLRGAAERVLEEEAVEREAYHRLAQLEPSEDTPEPPQV